MNTPSYLAAATMGHIGGPAPVEDKDPAKLRRGEAERLFYAEMLYELRCIRESTTAAAGHLARVVNGVLLVETVLFDSSASPIAREFPVAAGAVEIRNLGSNDMTLHAAGPGPAAPNSGVGVYPIPAGACALVNIAGRQFTLYGTAGDKASLQVFTAGGVSQPSPAGINGGVA